MKTVLNASDDGTLFRAHLAQSSTTLAHLVEITPTVGNVIRMATHDKDITYNGEVYHSELGYNKSLIRASSSAAVDNLTIDGFYHANGLLRQDLIAGRYDYAACTVYLVNWADVTMGAIVLCHGHFGQCEIRDNKFVTDFRSLTQALQQPIGRVISPLCDLELGCSFCGVNLAHGDFTQPGEIATVTSRSVFTVTITGGSTVDGFYTGGKIIFDSVASGGGDNHELIREIHEHDYTAPVHTITTYTPFPFDIDVADEFLISAGCDKTKESCTDKFSNWNNFAGFLFVPTADAAQDYVIPK